MKPNLRLACLALVAVVAMAFLAGCSGDDDDASATPAGSTPGATTTAGSTVKVGALLPITGTLSTYGETSKAALDDLVSTLNKTSKVVDLKVQDTKSDAPTALTLLQSLHSDGYDIVIGPYSSSEVQAVKDYANQNGMILISPLSTATSLATADNIYRFTPDDSFEGVAVAALAYADGIRTMVAVSRDDPGNLGLQTAFKSSFEKLGGKVVPGVTYPATETDFKDEVKTIGTAITGAAASGPAGVYLTAFGEVTSLLGAASDAGGDALNGVAWYGSDSVAQSKDLVADSKASAFAAAAKYPNPILGLRDADKTVWGPVSDRLAAQLKRTPDAFALAAYDGLNIAVKVMQNAGSKDVAGRKAELVSLTGSTTGLTGPLTLNAAGDRAIGIYDFWSVCQKNNAWTWYRSATYNPTDGAKELGPC
jgi:branched-chain amino acid transport system substrate-binding protein